MNTIEQYYLIFVIIQLLHSQEEIHTGFHKRLPVFKLSKTFFVLFEVFFSLLIILPIFYKNIPFRTTWMYFFNLLMLANGISHFVWAEIEKKYVPGLITGIFFLLFFLYYYFHFLVR